MRIVDLTPEHEQIYFRCLEDWSDEMDEAGDHKKHWYCRMKDKGLRVKLAEDDRSTVGGMIQYIPIEYAEASGADLYFVLCIWVHGYKEGRGNFQKQGMGKALLKAAEEDARGLGAKGLAVWGVSLPFFMRASWYRKQGYQAVDRIGGLVLLWKPFTEDAEAPRWIRQRKQPELRSGKVTVSAFINGWCPAQNMTFERAKRAASEFGNTVIFQEYDTSDRAVFLEWGISDALFIENHRVNTGPPPSYGKIRNRIAKQVKKLEKRG